MSVKILNREEVEEIVKQFVHSELELDDVNENITAYVEQYIHSEKQFTHFRSMIRQSMMTAISATMRKLYDTRRVTPREVAESVQLHKSELRKKRKEENEAIRIKKTVRQSAVAFRVLNELMMENK